MGCNVSKDVKVAEDSHNQRTEADGAPDAKGDKEAALSGPKVGCPESVANKPCSGVALAASKEDKEQVEKAAVRIQASFRGYKVRKDVPKIKDDMKGMQKFIPEQVKTAAAAAQEAAEEDLDIDLNDPDLSKAATKIQASFRGHKTRKEVKDVKDHVVGEVKQIATSAKQVAATVQEEVVDMDLTDPDLAKAATKIQASFRGYQTRRDPKATDE